MSRLTAIIVLALASFSRAHTTSGAGIATLNASAGANYVPLPYRGSPSSRLLRGGFSMPVQLHIVRFCRARNTYDMPDWLPKDFTYFEIGKSLVPPLAGALAGALAAQGIAARNKVREEQIKELRFIGVTTAIAYGVTEAFIGVKKSNVKPMFEHWNSDRLRREEIVRNNPPGTPPGLFEFNADFRTLTPVKASVDQLRTLMFGNITLDPRAVALMTALDRCVDQHAQIIAENNKLIAEFERDRPNAEQLAARLFGIPAGTRVDDRYSSTIRALNSGTDDCIMFSKLLGDDLVEHGKRLAAKLPKRLRGRYVATDFSRAEREGLMPNPNDFAQWLSPTSTPAQRRKLRERIKRAFQALSE